MGLLTKDNHNDNNNDSKEYLFRRLILRNQQPLVCAMANRSKTHAHQFIFKLRYTPNIADFKPVKAVESHTTWRNKTKFKQKFDTMTEQVEQGMLQYFLTCNN